MAKTETTYQKVIREALYATRELRLMTFPPRAVEAILRADYSTLDHLSRERLGRESVDVARGCIAEGVSRDELESFALAAGL